MEFISFRMQSRSFWMRDYTHPSKSTSCHHLVVLQLCTKSATARQPVSGQTIVGLNFVLVDVCVDGRCREFMDMSFYCWLSALRIDTRSGDAIQRCTCKQAFSVSLCILLWYAINTLFQQAFEDRRFKVTIRLTSIPAIETFEEETPSLDTLPQALPQTLEQYLISQMLVGSLAGH